MAALVKGRAARSRAAVTKVGADFMAAGGAGVRRRELGRGGCALVRRRGHTCETNDVVTGDSGRRGDAGGGFLEGFEGSWERDRRVLNGRHKTTTFPMSEFFAFQHAGINRGSPWLG